jgi:hypothetical protein
MATKLKELPSILVRNYLARTPTFIRGKPAIGKTETIDEFVAKMAERVEGFKVWRFYAPTMSPMDIQASAPNYESKRLDFFNNAALPNAYDTPDAVGVIFFGELPNADRATTKLLQKYINGEDMSGVLRKPDGVVVIADGNRIEDKSDTQQQGRAFLSRFEHIEAYTDAEDNMKYAMEHAWHPLVQTFFKDNPHLIDNYDEVFGMGSDKKGGAAETAEEGKLGIWANMRSWQRISKKEYVADQLKSPLSLAEATGNLGSGVGAAYEAHKKNMLKLASFEDVITMPDKVKIPDAMDEKYALCMVVALRCEETQLPQVHTFGARMPYELQAALLRNMAARKNFNLAASPAYAKWISNPELTALLNGR